MTEIVLNALWFMLAIASFGLLFRNISIHRAERLRGPGRLQCVVALGCVLAILFPVISLTDDLHDMQAAVEDPSSSGLTVKKFGASPQWTPTCTQHQLLFIVSSFHVTVVSALFGEISIRQKVRVSSGLSLHLPGRAPPSV